jgi:hypothetical protein
MKKLLLAFALIAAGSAALPLTSAGICRRLFRQKRDRLAWLGQAVPAMPAHAPRGMRHSHPVQLLLRDYRLLLTP